MSRSPAYVVLCVLACLAEMSRQQVCLGGKFLCRVNAIAPASTWMVRYVISNTPFWWHVQCDCPALLSIELHWHPLWFCKLPNLPAPFVMMLLFCRKLRCVTHYLLIPFLDFLGLTWLFCFARNFCVPSDGVFIVPSNLPIFGDFWKFLFRPFFYVDRRSTEYVVSMDRRSTEYVVYMDRGSTEYCWLRG